VRVPHPHLRHPDRRLGRRRTGARREVPRHPPASTLVAVTALVDETMLVEIEAEAVIGAGSP
jgi:hypothetical protein